MTDQPNQATDPRVEAVARELHAIACDDGDRNRRLEQLHPVQRWADPWHPGGIRQLRKLREDAARIVAVLDVVTDART